MFVAPLIHTRTYENDFDPNLKVVPKSFLDSDIIWARKNILEATKEIDDLQHGVRWVIVDNSRYRIAGVVGFLNDICSRSQSNGEDNKYEELFRDVKNRFVYAFIGLAIDKSRTDNFVPITYDYLWNTFVEYIQPVWKKTYQEQIKSDFTDIVIYSNEYNTNLAEAHHIGSKEIYECNGELDYNLFLKYLCNRETNNFSLCTNISSYNVLKSSSFSIITTTNNNLTRYSRETSILQSTALTSPDLTAISGTTPEKSNNDVGNSKKKNSLLVASCLTILLLIILVALLMMNPDLFQ